MERALKEQACNNVRPRDLIILCNDINRALFNVTRLNFKYLIIILHVTIWTLFLLNALNIF